MNRYNNSKLRASLRKQLISERGKVCQNCGCTKSKKGLEFSKMSEVTLAKFLVLHENDNNKKNLEPANCLIICKACNIKIELDRGLTPFQKKLEALNRIRTETRMYKQNEILTYGTEGMRRNVVGLKAVREWLDVQLEQNIILEVSWVIANASSVGGVTIATIENSWLVTLTSDSDNYKFINNKMHITKRNKPEGLEEKYAS